MNPIVYTSEMASGKFPIDEHNLPWPLDSQLDDSRNWSQLEYNERMKRISQNVLDWHHEEWMQVLDC